MTKCFYALQTPFYFIKKAWEPQVLETDVRRIKKARILQPGLNIKSTLIKLIKCYCFNIFMVSVFPLIKMIFMR